MKPLLKNTKESCNKEGKQEEDNLRQILENNLNLKQIGLYSNTIFGN